MILEVIAQSVEDVVAIQDSGAHRIELVQGIEVGGVTPSFALIERVLTEISIPTVVMVRPRGGNFVYSEYEKEVMLRDIELISALKPAAIITGSLTVSGEIDREYFERAIGKSQVPVVCHRCFDHVSNPILALEELVSLEVSRVLTSGQKPTAIEGVELIAALYERSAGRIEILPGSGIRKGNGREILRRTGCNQLHFSCWKSTSDYKSVDSVELKITVQQLSI